MKIIEAMLISLLITIFLLNLNVIKQRYVVHDRRTIVKGVDVVLAWLNKKGILKNGVYTRDSKTLRGILTDILEIPYSLVVLDLNGSTILEVSYGVLGSSRCAVFLLPGVNGTLKPVVVMFKVSTYEP